MSETTQATARPSWDKAPSWANYLAMDADGDWYWYEVEPVDSTTLWVVQGNTLAAHAGKAAGWRETLEQRPEPAGDGVE